MKSFLYTIIFALGLGMQAQEIGLRFGDTTGHNVAVDAMFNFKDSRIHANLAFNDGLGIEGVYHFIYNPIETSLNWYAGLGASTYIKNDFNLGLNSEIGIEYVFKDKPWVLGIDYRPTLWIIDNVSFKWSSFGINLRYQF